MPIANESYPVENGEWVARVRPPLDDTDPQLVLMVHGWTGDERSMWVFARAMPENAWLVAPRAPFAAPEGGYSWVEKPRSLEVPFEDFKSSADRLVAWIDGFDEIPAHLRHQFVLIGFSQGAALCYSLALAYPFRASRLAGLSGFMPPGAERKAVHRPLEATPCLVAHGIEDQRVPISRAVEAVRVLEVAGAMVQFCEDRGGHKTSSACIKTLQRFLSEP